MAPKQHAVTLSRFLLRLLDKRKHSDYLVAFLIGAWPIGLWYLIGAHRVEIANHGYRGYWDTPNWTSLAILLPAILYALRWATGKIMPVVHPELPERAPPIINVLRDETAQQAIYTELRQYLASKTNLIIVLLLTFVVTVLDMGHVLVRFYERSNVGAQDWTTLYLLPDSISLGSNIAFVAFAYIGQVAATFIGMLAMVLFFRHNRFFVGHIYQRRWVKAGDKAHYFLIDVNDVNRCFGFRPTNEAFNTQVKGLMVAGLAMLISRLAHTLQSARVDAVSTDGSSWLSWLPQFSFPVPGQWLMALSWLVGLCIVAMPSVIKLLPWLRSAGNEHVHLSVDHYLQEFFPDEAWPKGPDGGREPVELVAAKFARNSFWPTGDNRARILFLFSYWVFLVILLPPIAADLLIVVVTFAAYGVAAYLLTLATFGSLKLALRYVDDLLVVQRHQATAEAPAMSDETDQKSELGIFISYRRSDTAPYARSILESLQEHFHRKNLFMDIENIQPGSKFGLEIDKALTRVDAVIALIGRDWSTVTDVNGNLRLHNPRDMIRYEIATAIEQHKRIFPVLVGGARMPDEDDLPEPLKELSHFNAVELSDTRWAYDMGVLVNALKQARAR